MINQLFIDKPPDSIILSSIILLGWSSLTDKRTLSRSDLDNQQISIKFINIINELRQYYLPCKQYKYLNNINTKSIITIVRQLLKTIGYNIRGIERVIDNKKEMVYKLEPYIKSKYTQHNTQPIQNIQLLSQSDTNNIITKYTNQSKFIVCWN